MTAAHLKDHFKIWNDKKVKKQSVPVCSSYSLFSISLDMQLRTLDHQYIVVTK